MRTALLLATLAALPILAASTTAAPVNTVVATDFQFLPEVITVRSGETVTWVQGTATFLAHTVSAPPLFDFEPGNVGTGGVIGSFTVTAPAGTVLQYVCKPHAILGMRGVIVVV